MDVFKSGSRGGRIRDERIKEAAESQKLCFSNFHITWSTNVRPGKDDNMKRALAAWLIDRAKELFSSFDMINGNVIKPAGTHGNDNPRFPDDNQILACKARFSVEIGGEGDEGKVHSHCLLEVAHTYSEQTDGAEGVGASGKPLIGVHSSAIGMRNYLNARIYLMEIPESRKPEKIYVNCRLLTTATDNSLKWLTYQYINKDLAKDNDGGTRDLRKDEAVTDRPDLTRARETLLKEPEFISCGGALPEGDVFRPKPKRGPRNFK